MKQNLKTDKDNLSKMLNSVVKWSFHLLQGTTGRAIIHDA